MIRKTLFGTVLAALAVLIVQAASIPLFTGPAGNNPVNDPSILGTANQIVNAVNQNVTPASMANALNVRNVLDNPKFDIYPISSGTAYSASAITATLTGITSTYTYLAGRWAAYSINASASAQLGWSGTSLPAGFTSALQVGRTSGNANTTQICLVQEVPSERVSELQGQQLYLSFYGLAGATFSAASSNLQIYVNTGTTADQGIGLLATAAPTTINSWTGAANQVNARTQAITTSWARYSGINAGVVPAAALELALQICYTPVGTAGATDNFQLTGVQLEASNIGSSVFEFRPLAYEAYAVGRFAQALPDGATTRRYAAGLSTTSSTSQFALALPFAMRTVPNTVLTTNSFATTTGAGIGPGFATDCASLAAISASNTTTSIGLTCTTTGTPLTAGQAALLSGANKAGVILANGEF